MNKLQRAEQLRRVLQLFAQSLEKEKAVEVATVFDTWKVGKAYNIGEYFSYGENLVGDPQIYKVIQAHKSQADWMPQSAVSLYSPIGLGESGYPLWSEPTGAHDAYTVGDVIEFNGILYESLINGNVYSPEAYPDGWNKVN